MNRSEFLATRTLLTPILVCLALTACGGDGPQLLAERDAFDGDVVIVATTGDVAERLVGRLTFRRGGELRFVPADADRPPMVQGPDGAFTERDGAREPLDPAAQARLLVLLTAVRSGPRADDAVERFDDGYRIESGDRRIEVRFVTPGR